MIQVLNHSNITIVFVYSLNGAKKTSKTIKQQKQTNIVILGRVHDYDNMMEKYCSQ